MTFQFNKDLIRVRSNRQLVAILFTDIVGYTSLMQGDEQKAIKAVKRYKQVLEYLVKKFQGRVLQYYGDGSLCVFKSATNTIYCSMLLQQQLGQEPRVPLRVGIHIGEVLVEEGSFYGDGINIASRIESVGKEGAILFSENVYQKIRNQPKFKTILLGSYNFKNVNDPIKIYAIANEGFRIPIRKK